MRVGERSAAAEPDISCVVAVVGPAQGRFAVLPTALRDDRTTVIAFDNSASLLRADAPDVVVLDAAIPAHSATGTYLRMRRQWPFLSIIVLPVSDERAATLLLGSGVDDAITAVASDEHLLARIRAATRRARARNSQRRLRVGDVVYSREDRKVWCGGDLVRMSPRELMIFDCLWGYAGSAVGLDALHDYAWPGRRASARIRRNRVAVYIRLVRSKLAGSTCVQIKSIRSIGYRLAHTSVDEAGPRRHAQ